MVFFGCSNHLNNGIVWHQDKRPSKTIRRQEWTAVVVLIGNHTIVWFLLYLLSLCRCLNSSFLSVSVESYMNDETSLIWKQVTFCYKHIFSVVDVVNVWNVGARSLRTICFNAKSKCGDGVVVGCDHLILKRLAEPLMDDFVNIKWNQS